MIQKYLHLLLGEGLPLIAKYNVLAMICTSGVASYGALGHVAVIDYAMLFIVRPHLQVREAWNV